MRYEEILLKTNNCGVHRTLFIIFITLSAIRQGTFIGIFSFSLSSPLLVCTSSNSTDFYNISTKDYYLDDVGWCQTGEYVNSSSCTQWTYAEPHVSRNIVQEWNLCGERMKVLFIQTLVIISFGLSATISAYLADRFGRLTVYIVAAVYECTIILIQSFSVNYWMYLITASTLGASQGALIVSFYTYINEIIYPKHRRYYEFLVFIGFSMGFCILAGTGYFLPSWRDYERAQIVYSGICLIVIGIALRESPKWLFVMHKEKQARKVIQKMARLNGLPKVPDNLLNNIVIEKEVKNVSPLDLCHSPQLIKNTLAAIVLATVSVMVYYIITWNSSTFFRGNLYINTAIMGVVESPNSVLFLVFVRFISKKYLLLSSLNICGVSLASGALVVSFLTGHKLVANVFFFISRVSANFSCNVFYSFAPELFPTSQRSLGYGISLAMSRVLMAPIPYVLMAADRQDILVPSLTMAGIVICGSTTLFCLPNTYGCRLPDTLEESKIFKPGNEHLFRMDTISLDLEVPVEVDETEGVTEVLMNGVNEKE